MLSFGLLIIRLILGLSFIGHGAQKLFGWFGGPGLKQTSGFFQSIGVKPGFPMAVLSGLAELLGGALLTVGLLTPLAGLIIAVTMVVAVVTVHGKNGYWATKNGYEYNLLIIAAAVGLALTGAGSYSVDALLFG